MLKSSVALLAILMCATHINAGVIYGHGYAGDYIGGYGGYGGVGAPYGTVHHIAVPVKVPVPVDRPVPVPVKVAVPVDRPVPVAVKVPVPVAYHHGYGGHGYDAHAFDGVSFAGAGYGAHGYGRYGYGGPSVTKIITIHSNYGNGIFKKK